MKQSNEFIGISITSSSCTGWLFADSQIIQIAMGKSTDTVLAQLQTIPPRPVYILDSQKGDSQSVPINVVPRSTGQSGPLHLLPIRQTTPPDALSAMSRLRIAGFLAINQNWDGVVLLLEKMLSQWVYISANEIVSFQSFLTGKIASAFDVFPATIADPEAITETMSRPERIATHLRSAEITHDPSATLGHLIGTEISAARPYWLGRQVTIISDIQTPENWENALLAQGVPVELHQSQPMMISGFLSLSKS